MTMAMTTTMSMVRYDIQASVVMLCWSECRYVEDGVAELEARTLRDGNSTRSSTLETVGMVACTKEMQHKKIDMTVRNVRNKALFGLGHWTRLCGQLGLTSCERHVNARVVDFA